MIKIFDMRMDKTLQNVLIFLKSHLFLVLVEQTLSELELVSCSGLNCLALILMLAELYVLTAC